MDSLSSSLLSTLLRNLHIRGIEAEYYETTEEAVSAVCSRIPANALVGLGGSETVIESGLLNALRSLNIRLLDRYTPGVPADDINRMRKEGLLSDIFICSTNALTLDGKLVNKDGLGNRLACLSYGPDKVFVIAGINKVVADLDAALERIRTLAAPQNAQRVHAGTPCFHSGVCQEERCFPPDRICNQVLITEGSRIAGRIRLFLVAQPLGY